MESSPPFSLQTAKLATNRIAEHWNITSKPKQRQQIKLLSTASKHWGITSRPNQRQQILPSSHSDITWSRRQRQQIVFATADTAKNVLLSTGGNGNKSYRFCTGAFISSPEQQQQNHQRSNKSYFLALAVWHRVQAKSYFLALGHSFRVQSNSNKIAR